MTLSSGARLGPYQIEAAIGAGGMGEVYRARDTRLDRTVAIKVLPAELSADPERRVRFEREARAVAALSHPHICTLYDIGEAVLPDGDSVAAGQRAGRVPSPESRIPARAAVHYLVMEHLAGESLAERLLRGPVPLAQALDVAAQIADALDAAHKHGIIHRDLKPGNVMLTSGGAGRSGMTTAKLLDFGLAKLVAHGERPALAGGASVPTQAAPVTAQGTILGTLQYMAPEQLEGKEADARTDIWALGAILYEMVTGKRAFEGESQVSLIGNIMNAEPPALAQLQPLTPPALDRMVRKCLAKHPDGRWDGAHDVADELRWIADELGIARTTSGGMPAPATIATAAGGRRWMRRFGLAAVTAVMMAALAAAAWWWRFGERPTLSPQLLVHLTSSPGSERFPALSPDGKQVAFQWNGEDGKNWDIYVKLVGETNALRLTTDALVDSDPCWSPDGRRIAFTRRGADGRYAVLTMSPLGGAEQKLADLPGLFAGTSWSPDGKWLVVARNRPSAAEKDDSAGIFVVPASGGDPVRVTSPRSPLRDHLPGFSPDGGSLAFVRSMGPDMAGEVFIQPLARDGAVTGDPRQITHSGMFIAGLAWHPDGRSVVYAAQPAFLLCYLYRVSIDGDAPPERIELAGPSAYAPSASPGINRLAFSRRRYRLGRLAPPAGWRRRARHPVLVRRLRAATLARWAPRRVHVEPEWRVLRNLDGERGRHRPDPTHARTRAEPGKRDMVPGRPLDSLRLPGHGWHRGHLRRRIQRRPAAATHLGAVKRDASDLVARRTVGLLPVRPDWKRRGVAGAVVRREMGAGHERRRGVCLRVDRREDAVLREEHE